jgi:hypothetical protein
MLSDKEILMRSSFFFLCFAVMWLLCSAQIASTDTPDPCANPMDHVTERECAEKRVSEAMELVVRAEQRVRVAIQRWGEDKYWKDASLAAFERSVKAFRAYQTDICDVDSSAAAGGNGAGDMHLDCEKTLADERVKYLAEQEKLFTD